MGTELFTSSRGPGVIGTVMALVVLAGFGALYFLVFDEDMQGGGQTIESIIAEDAKQVDSLKKSLVAKTKELAATEGFRDIALKVSQESTRLTVAENRHAELLKTRDERSQLVAAADKAIEDYKRAYRESARASMVGKEMDELKTLEGKSFTQVKVTSVDGARMQIRHSGGITGVALDQLPMDLQDYLQVSKEEREEIIVNENESNEVRTLRARFAEVQHHMETLKHNLRGKEDEQLQAEQALDRTVASIPDLERQIGTKQQELGQHERKARSGGISNAPQIRAQINALEGRVAAANRKIPSIRSEISRIRDEQGKMRDGIEADRKQLDEIRAKIQEKLAESGKEPESGS